MSGTVTRISSSGLLNRALTQVVFSDYPALNASIDNMSSGFMHVTFEGAPTLQIGTGTSIVNSPNPYVMGSLQLNILRTQALATTWLRQMQSNSVLGNLTGYPDAAPFDPITLENSSITAFDPGAWDGQNPTVAITITGLFFTNNDMWASL